MTLIFDKLVAVVDCWSIHVDAKFHKAKKMCAIQRCMRQKQRMRYHRAMALPNPSWLTVALYCMHPRPVFCRGLWDIAFSEIGDDADNNTAVARPRAIIIKRVAQSVRCDSGAILFKAITQSLLTRVNGSDGESVRGDAVQSEPATVHWSIEHVEQRQLIVVANRRQVKRHHHSLRYTRIHRPRPVDTVYIPVCACWTTIWTPGAG